MTGTQRVSAQSPISPLRTLCKRRPPGCPKKKGRAQRGPSANSLSPSPFNIFANHRPFCIPCDILKPSNTRHHLLLHPHTSERFTNSGAEDSANARHRSWTLTRRPLIAAAPSELSHSSLTSQLLRQVVLPALKSSFERASDLRVDTKPA